jgi:Flp pilus assembly protein TadG
MQRYAQSPYGRRRLSQRGSTLVETALVITCMLLLILGVFEGAYAVWGYTTLSQAARHGVRYAMIRGTANPATDEAIQDKVREHATGLTIANVQAVTTWTPNRQMGSEVEVRATYNFPLMLSSFIFTGPSISLRSTARAIVTY